MIVSLNSKVSRLAQPTHATVNSSGAGANVGKGSMVCTASVRLVLAVASSKDTVVRYGAGVPALGLATSLGPLSKLSFVGSRVDQYRYWGYSLHLMLLAFCCLHHE
ncbi:hypothetical protein LY78DRAFT_445581 [Colletotrichum sublineola]|nr:hypothetical protein LY78DRAFT_445581 [Colletotrichum sublineola]